MKLTAKQIQFLNNEIEINNRILKSGPSEGVFSLLARQEALRIVIQLHNIKD